MNGTFVKEHKGIKIYVNHNGEFFCDTKNNSSNYFLKTNHSEKLSSLEKFIDNLNSKESIHIEEYYYINPYAVPAIKKLKSKIKTANKIYFDNGEEYIAASPNLFLASDLKNNFLEDLYKALTISGEIEIKQKEAIEINQKITESRSVLSKIHNSFLKNKMK